MCFYQKSFFKDRTSHYSLEIFIKPVNFFENLFLHAKNYKFKIIYYIYILYKARIKNLKTPQKSEISWIFHVYGGAIPRESIYTDISRRN